MKIKNIEITETQINAMMDRMKSAPFQCSDITLAARNAGVVPQDGYDGIACRAADRLIQKMRKHGKIKISKYPTWTWVA